MRNHFLILIFILLSLNALAENKCILLSKDPAGFKFKFKCGAKEVAVDCVSEAKKGCELEVRGELSSYSFKLTDDEWKSFKLFEKEDLTTTSCEAKYKVCGKAATDCVAYVGSYDKIIDSERDSLINSATSCNQSGLKEIRKIAGVSVGLIGESEFRKADCNDPSGKSMQALDTKFALLRKNLTSPIVNRHNLVNMCLVFSNEQYKQDFIQSGELKNFQEKFESQTKDLKRLKELICHPNLEKIYEKGELSFDRVMCLMFEDIRATSFKPQYEFTCKKNNDGKGGASDSRVIKINGNTAAAATAQDLPPAESQPLPAAMASAVDTPTGLNRALSSVDRIVPDGYNTESNEGTIASGSARTAPPSDIAIRAGEAFAPVFNKFEEIAASAGNIGSSGRSVPVGRNTLAQSSRGTASAGSTRAAISAGLGTKIGTAITPPKFENIELDSGVESVTAGSQALGDIKPAGLKKLGVNGAGPDAEPASGRVGSARLGTSGGSVTNGSGGISSGQINNTPTFESDTQARKKIISLKSKSTDEIKYFFANEAAEIAGIRNLIYKDSAVNKALSEAGIRIVGVNDDATIAGAELNKSVLLFSDNGKKFIPVPIPKKK